MNKKLKYLTAIVITSVLLPLVDKLSVYCFGSSLKATIAAQIEAMIEKQLIAKNKRHTAKLRFIVESKEEVLDDLEKTTLSVQMANSLADCDFTKHEVAKSNNGDKYLHTYTVELVM
jgi:predicted Rossmann-fold nucleotide-binding protein